MEMRCRTSSKIASLGYFQGPHIYACRIGIQAPASRWHDALPVFLRFLQIPPCEGPQRRFPYGPALAGSITSQKPISLPSCWEFPARCDNKPAWYRRLGLVTRPMDVGSPASIVSWLAPMSSTVIGPERTYRVETCVDPWRESASGVRCGAVTRTVLELAGYGVALRGIPRRDCGEKADKGHCE